MVVTSIGQTRSVQVITHSLIRGTLNPNIVPLERLT